MDADAVFSTEPRSLNVYHPATGTVVGRVTITPSDEVHQAATRARAAQSVWGSTRWENRREVLRRLWTELSREAETWADAIRDEIGKPRSESMGEVVMGLDGIRWTVKYGQRALCDERFGAGWQRAMLIPGGRLGYRPLGVIGIIGTWNYPFFLNAPAIVQALAAGNGVVWKPSELALGCGERLQHAFDRAGFPEGLVSAVYGGADVGSALVESAIDKGVFTGGLENGRRVLGALASRGIPSVAELSGFDPAIVLPDAPRDATVRALTWGAFVGAGQTCVSVKRAYIIGNATPWVEALAAAASALRQGDPSREAVDVGPMISESARQRFHDRIQAAVQAGATIVSGGAPLSREGWFYAPTVLTAKTDAVEPILEGVFGPVVLVRGVGDIDAAVRAANSSVFGLAASVWGTDRRRLRSVAERLQAGLVTLNDVITPAGHASAPFGGTKASGFGRTHGVLGLREFTFPQAVIGRRGPGGFRPQLFPYRQGMERLLSWYVRFFHPHA